MKSFYVPSSKYSFYVWSPHFNVIFVMLDEKANLESNIKEDIK